VVSTPVAGCSPGFFPSRVRGRWPFPGFRRESSRTLRRSGQETHPDRPAPRSVNRPSLDLLLPQRQALWETR
jgi:hypothetical protein